MDHNYVILGGGGFARETYHHILDAHRRKVPEGKPKFCFVDEISKVDSLQIGSESFPLIHEWQFPPDFRYFTIGVGQPALKRVLVQKALDSGLVPAPTIVHPDATVQCAELGRGGIITPGCRITTNVKIGDYVIVNLNSTIGHDAVIGDFSTINPGCNISGNVSLGADVVLGTGAVVREKMTIADGCIAGAQAAIVTSFEQPKRLIVGVPAREKSK